MSVSIYVSVLFQVCLYMILLHLACFFVFVVDAIVCHYVRYLFCC